MSVFFVFAWNNQYPLGGMSDYVGVAPTAESAVLMLDTWLLTDGWEEIISGAGRWEIVEWDGSIMHAVMDGMHGRIVNSNGELLTVEEED